MPLSSVMRASSLQPPVLGLVDCAGLVNRLSEQLRLLVE